MYEQQPSEDTDLWCRTFLLKRSLIFDEFPTIYLDNMDSLIATARSNKVATKLGIQDFSQLKKGYGREQADVIMNIVGNIVSGQVTGDTAKQLSERFGKIMQDRESLSINSSDTSFRSQQLESAQSRERTYNPPLLFDYHHPLSSQVVEPVFHGLYLLRCMWRPYFNLADYFEWMYRAVGHGRVAGELLVRYIRIVF